MEKLSKYIPKILAGGAVFALLIFALIGIDYYQKSAQTDGLSDSELLKTAKEDILDYEIRPVSGTASSENGGESEGVVVYHYVSDQIVPAANYQGLKEDLSKRTASAQSFLKSVKKNAKGQLEKEYIGKFYSADNWQKKGEKWFQIETATTTPVAFERQTELTLLDRAKEFIGQPAYAAVNTTYSGAGDGKVYAGATGHDASSGAAADATTVFVQPGYHPIIGDVLERTFFPFNTSDLPDNSEIIAVNFKINGSGTLLTADAYGFLTVVQTTQASPTTLGVDDFDQCGAISNPIEGIDTANRIFTADISPNVYFSFPLNETGKSWVSKIGYTQLGVREGHDVLNSAPANSSYADIYTSEQAGTSQDPYLEITYVMPDFVNIDGGTINLDGGTMIID